MRDSGNIELNNGPVVQDVRDVMASGANQLHSAVYAAWWGRAPLNAGKNE